MVLPEIFCPECGALVLDAAICSACRWRRPATDGEIGQPAWRVALDVKLPRHGSRPVAAGHVAYFPTEGGQIVALDTGANGSDQAINWRYQLDSRYSCQGVTVWDEYLLFGTEYTGGFPTPKGELTVLSARSGDEQWLLPLEGASVSTPAVQAGLAYFTDNTGWLYAIDLTARQELWRHKIEPPWSWAPAAPTLTPTGLLLPGRSEQLLAFDLEKRAPAWSFSVEEAWFPHSPVWVEGTVYVRCWDRHIYALDGATGQELWRFKAPRDFNSDLWVTENYLYVGVKDYNEDGQDRSPAYALYTLDRRSGALLSRYGIDGHILARPVATPEAVFFASDDRTRLVENQGTLYALDAGGRELLWEPQVVEQRFSSDLLLVGNLLIAGARSGAIYAVPWQTVAELKSPQFYLEREEWAPAAVALALQGEYVRAAEIYEQKLGQPDRAGRLYRQAGDHRRVIDPLGSPTGAVEAHRDDDELVTAASLAESSGQYNEALALYRELGQNLKAAEMLEKLSRFGEAAEILEKEKEEHRAAQNWERQVDLKIEQLGGIRYAKRNEEIVHWLKRAIEVYEEEEEYAESEEERAEFRICAERGRLKLMQVQREPLMQVAFQTDSLVVGRGAVVRCVVENVGWGTAREPMLFITSRELEHDLDVVPLETLKRNETVEREFTVVPTVGGAITLKVKFQGQSRDGEPLEFKVDGSPYVVLEAQAGAPLVTGPARPAVDANWGSIWEESRGGSTGGSATGPISAEDLKQQKIQALRQRLTQYYANLHKLQEQADQYGAGMAPLILLNQIEQEERYIEEIETELQTLESQV